jgi:hypothetical protein
MIFITVGTTWGMGQGGAASYEGMASIGSNSLIQLNTVRASGYNGIEFRGSNITLKNNYIDSFNIRKDDGGGIYTAADVPAVRTNQLVDGNICVNGGGGFNSPNNAGAGTTTTNSDAFGIYFDGNSNGITLINNTMANCGSGGLFLNGDSGLIVRSNTTYNCNITGATNGAVTVVTPTAFPVTIPMRGVRFANNIIVQKAAQGGAPVITSFVVNFQTTTDANMANWVGVGGAFPGSLWDSNYYCRPFSENGGTMRRQTTGGITTSNLAGWQAFTASAAGGSKGYDIHSKISPKTIPDTTSNNIRFYENHTQSPVTIALPGTWIDMKNVAYPGTVTLAPFTSVVLLFSTAVGSPLAGTATIAQNPVTCFGNTTSITINATGGTSPYQYRIGAGAFSSTNVFTGLAAGTYTFQVRDAALTVVTVQATITQPAQITISQSSPPITINGNTTTTTVTASGGTGTLQYKLDAGAFQSSNVFTLVGAGTHTITVRDANLCTNTLTYTLTQPSVLVLSLAAGTNPLTCFGNTTTITATASGGTTPYTYKLNGGTSQSSNVFSNNVAGTYQVTVTDAAGAVTTQTIVITQPTQITITESHTAIVVNGGTSTVTITASGGTGTLNYSLDGGTFQVSNVFSGVLAGNHSIRVRDANLCINTLAFTITQPSNLIVTSSITTAIPCNGSTGTITGSASGGTSPYDYQVNGGTRQSSAVFSGLTAGTYTLTVHDAGGAIVSASPLTLSQPAQITVSVAFGSAPATVTVTASGGVGTLNYSLDGGTFQASNVFNAVAAGNHTVTVRDANLCTAPKSFTVLAPLVANSSVTNATCNGGNGTVVITGSGGQPPYSGTGTFSQAAGTVTYTIQDNLGAVATKSVTVTQPAAINVSVATVGSPATVTVTATNGVGTLSYRLDGGTPQASNVFTSVAAGNHTVVVTDANGCTGQKAFTVGASLAITASSTNPVCNGGNGSVTIGASGGTAPYTGTGVFAQAAGTHLYTITDNAGATHDTTITITQPAAIGVTVATTSAPATVTVTAVNGVGLLAYRLDGGSPQGSNVFSSVAAGNHTITVTDANGCVGSVTFNIGTALSISLSVGTISCNGGTTTATVIPAGGTFPYTFLWSTGNQTSTVNNLVAGTYSVRVTDNVAHIHDTTFVITQPTSIAFTITTGTILINGGTTTAQATSVSGGAGGYTYSLDGGAYQGSSSFAGVAAGTHTLTVKDANSCTKAQFFTLTQPGALIITISRGAAISCAGGTQNITVGGTGGTTPYTGTGVFAKLAGTYTFSITDAFGATADTIINVTQPSPIVVSVAFTAILINGGTSTVTVTASGGTGGLTYSLDGGGYQGSNVFAGVSAGTHTITVKDANTCTQGNSFSISQPTALTQTATAVTSSLTCYGDVTTVNIVAAGGTAPLTYGKNGVFGGSASFTNLTAGTYTFSTKDAFNARQDTIITISQPPLITLTQVTQYPSIVTYGGNADSVIVASAGGVPINDSVYQYAIDGGSYTTSDSAFKYRFTSVSGGQHTVSIKDASGCVQTYSFFVEQSAAPLPYIIKRKPKRHIYVQL